MVDYFNFKVFEALVFVHIKQDKLDVRIVKCIFIDYQEGMKGYKSWKMDPRGSKFIISMDATFDEVCLRMKCKDLEVKETKTMMGKT